MERNYNYDKNIPQVFDYQLNDKQSKQTQQAINKTLNNNLRLPQYRKSRSLVKKEINCKEIEINLKNSATDLLKLQDRANATVNLTISAGKHLAYS